MKSNLIATITMKPIQVYDDIFESEEEKELYMNAPTHEKYQYLINIIDNEPKDYIIDLYE